MSYDRYVNQSPHLKTDVRARLKKPSLEKPDEVRQSTEGRSRRQVDRRCPATLNGQVRYFASTWASCCTFSAPSLSARALTARMSSRLIPPALDPARGFLGRPSFLRLTVFVATGAGWPSDAIVQPHASCVCNLAWIGLPHFGQGLVGNFGFLAMRGSLNGRRGGGDRWRFIIYRKRHKQQIRCPSTCGKIKRLRDFAVWVDQKQFLPLPCLRNGGGAGKLL